MSEDLTGKTKRAEVIAHLAMTEGEQDQCWRWLNDVESASLNRDALWFDRAFEALVQRLYHVRGK